MELERPVQIEKSNNTRTEKKKKKGNKKQNLQCVVYYQVISFPELKFFCTRLCHFIGWRRSQGL